MKRTLVLLTAALMLAVSLAGCGGRTEAPAVESAAFSGGETPGAAGEPTAAPAAEPAAAQTPEPTPEETFPPLAETEAGPFPGGLDDDGRGPEEEDGDVFSEPTALTAEEQYKVNLFLSNFAEQFFGGYWDGETGYISLQVDFAHMWCKINDRSSIRYETKDGEAWEVLDLDRADQVVRRYFPNGLTGRLPEELQPARVGFMADGKLYFPASDGEAYNRVAVADRVEKDPEGVYHIAFSVYEVDLEEYFDRGVDPRYYWLSPAEAAAEESLTCLYGGAALAQDGVWNGKDVYQLLSYYIR